MVREGTFPYEHLEFERSGDDQFAHSRPRGLQEETTQITVIINADIRNTEDGLREIRKRIRVEHVNDVERRSNVRICEGYNDILHLPGDILRTTMAAEYAIPSPGIDPCSGIASRNYRIPEAVKGELNQITDTTRC
jgi:hypothetical protein